MKNEKAIVIGDTVRLRSGGPLMTVGEAADENHLSCVWFNTNAMGSNFEEGCFHRDTLVVVDSREEPL